MGKLLLIGVLWRVMTRRSDLNETCKHRWLACMCNWSIWPAAMSHRSKSLCCLHNCQQCRFLSDFLSTSPYASASLSECLHHTDLGLTPGPPHPIPTPTPTPRPPSAVWELVVQGSPSAVGSPAGWAAPHTHQTPSGLYWQSSVVSLTWVRKS